MSTSALSFLDHFSSPDPAYSPAPIWWWSGEPLEVNRLCWQMDQLVAMGVYNVVILNLAPSGPLYGCDADDPPFLSEAWWAVFKQVCDHARAIGMRIWFYDQIGFSGANFQAELVAQHPEFSAEALYSASVEGSGELRVRCPGDGRPIAAYVVPLELGDPAAIEPIYVPIADGEARWQAAVPSRLRLVYALRQGFDYFSPQACDRLLDTVHREFARRVPEHIGTTIVGSFQDELPNLPTWGATFAASFAAAYGYALTERIHALFDEGGPAEQRVRLDYHRHRAALAEAAFFKPFFAWHQQYGLICGFDQQGPAREGKPIACVGKYADYMQTHRWYGAPGCDLHGHEKIHSSLAFLYDRPRVWIEGFHSTGWGGSLEETFDWLIPWLRAGATLYNPHAVYYSVRKGWWEWAPPSTCWRQPYAMHYRGFADAISRLTRLLAQGVHEAEVAVLFPTATVQAALGVERPFPEAEAAQAAVLELMGEMSWLHMWSGVLDRACLDYHFFDDESIARAEIAADKLVYRGVTFGTVILPRVTVLDAATTRKLSAFVRAGGRLYAVGAWPRAEACGDDESIRALHDACAQSATARCFSTMDELEVALAELPRKVRAPVPTLHRRLGEAGNLHVLFVPATALMATENPAGIGGRWFERERVEINHARYLRQATLHLADAPPTVYRWDPLSGRTVVLPSTAGAVALDFQDAPCAVLVWDDRERVAADQSGPALQLARAIALDGRWLAEYRPTLNAPGIYVDIGESADAQAYLPKTWRVKWRRGVVDVEAALANGLSSDDVAWLGFGTRAWCIGPLAVEMLPQPAADPGGYPPADWQPVMYSLERGIHKDPIHSYTLGPKGHVPEEFMHFGELKAGQGVQVRTVVSVAHEQAAILAIGAAAHKLAWVNGQAFEQADDKYLWMQPVNLKAGANSIEFRLVARQATPRLRAHWCVLRPGTEAAFVRPERIIAPGEPQAGTQLRFKRAFILPVPLSSGRMQVAVAGVARVYLDGQLLGRQGGFDPYAISIRVQPYDLPPLGAGPHEIVVEVTDIGAAVATFFGASTSVLVDVQARLQDGAQFELISDEHWQVSRDGGEFVPVAIQAEQSGDPAFSHLRRRPHPLPRAAWLEGPQPAVVLDVEPDAGWDAADDGHEQWFEWLIPPGAHTMRIPLARARRVELWVDGKATAPGAMPGAAPDVVVALDSPVEGACAARRALLRLHGGAEGGAAFRGPIEYTFGAGLLDTVDWGDQGLESYSGAMRLRRTIVLDGPRPDGATLDLGRVRGTVEAHVNGVKVGERFMSPYRFDVTSALRAGENTIELIVTNTLGPYLQSWSPTQMIYSGQLKSGVLGPVRLLTFTSSSPA